MKEEPLGPSTNLCTSSSQSLVTGDQSPLVESGPYCGISPPSLALVSARFLLPVKQEIILGWIECTMRTCVFKEYMKTGSCFWGKKKKKKKKSKFHLLKILPHRQCVKCHNIYILELTIIFWRTRLAVGWSNSCGIGGGVYCFPLTRVHDTPKYIPRPPTVIYARMVNIRNRRS